MDSSMLLFYKFLQDCQECVGVVLKISVALYFRILAELIWLLSSPMLAAWLPGTRSITQMRGSGVESEELWVRSDLGRDEGTAHTVDVGVVVALPPGPRLGRTQAEHRLELVPFCPQSSLQHSNSQQSAKSNRAHDQG